MGKSFFEYNSGGFLERVDLEKEELGQLFQTKFQRANNDHGISFEWKRP